MVTRKDKSGKCNLCFPNTFFAILHTSYSLTFMCIRYKPVVAKGSDTALRNGTNYFPRLISVNMDHV
jgi:hypothetical protein